MLYTQLQFTVSFILSNIHVDLFLTNIHLLQSNLGLLTFIFCNTHLDWFLTNIHFCEWCTHYLAQCFHSYHNHNVHPKQLFYTSTTVCSYSHTRHSYSITIDAITHSYLQPKFKPFLNNVFIHVNHVGLNKISTFTTLFKLCINFHWMKVL